MTRPSAPASVAPAPRLAASEGGCPPGCRCVECRLTDTSDQQVYPASAAAWTPSDADRLVHAVRNALTPAGMSEDADVRQSVARAVDLVRQLRALVPVPCGICYGRGYVTERRHGSPSDVREVPCECRACPTCHGSGRDYEAVDPDAPMAPRCLACAGRGVRS